MVQYHRPTKKKASGSGGRKRRAKDKRLAQYGGFFARPKLVKEGEKQSRKEFRVRGGGKKIALETVLYANTATPSGVKKARILSVVETKADPHLARENVLVKGAVIDTELGRARVTSRPGQCGVVNAVLLEEKERKEEKRETKQGKETKEAKEGKAPEHAHTPSAVSPAAQEKSGKQGV